MQALSDPRLKRASALIAALSVCGAASAASYDQTYTHVDEKTSWMTNTTQAFNKFDPTLGTLTSVDFYLGGTMATQAELNNKNTNARQTITNNTVGHYGIYGTGTDSSTYFYSSSSTLSYTEDLGIGDGSSAYVAPHGIVEPKTNLAFASSAMSFTDTATLLRFTGPGSISLMFYASAVSNGTTGVNSNIANITSADGNGFLRYNYTANATPEPASFGALAIGAIALMRRRKAVVR